MYVVHPIVWPVKFDVTLLNRRTKRVCMYVFTYQCCFSVVSQTICYTKVVVKSGLVISNEN